ncbi:phage major capsid protein [Clostridium botulinum]|uniref:phage major capsid protein n=1 Tax=Clostridium botulinum TaxID=1491 RepID=UPI00069A30BD|nr:phage major capsid protein [Clostridium botulinum]KOA90868.1 capsid protein [Clostridium botulinum]MCD3203431.1 phage major capsid protein [Clostridium botulinum C/D]MCD3222294.1 phage major capsid protein [Clostridium botulinum C/D]MCD3231435.1 phage major capsid protein [Clostridium botulinum C/D]MCD3273067.1 phage major capsid protein [Clostridium botulinum C/D]
MTVKERKEEIRSLTEKMKGFIEKRDLDNAKKTKEEIRTSQELLKIEKEHEEEEKRDLEKQKNDKNKEKRDLEKGDEFRNLVKYVIGERLTEEERAAIKTTDNSAIIPKQFVNKLIEIQKGYGSLKSLCDVIPVNKNEGTIPIVDLDQNEMNDIEEGKDIVDGTLVTKDVSFKCAKVGLIQTITSETLDDAVIDVETLVKKNFANIATIKENKKIINTIEENATEETGTDYTTIENLIDSSLPTVKTGLVTLTNIEGYCYLKNMKDKDGRPLNLITVVNGIEYFHGKPIITADSSLFKKLTDGKTMVFYVLNFKEAVKFIDRKQITLAKSVEAGFENDTVKLRILERFDVIEGSKRSIKKIEL